MAKADKTFGDDVWSMRKDAHQIHHKIADFILHKDSREHPPGLRNLVKRYTAMMEEADERAPSPSGKSERKR